MKSFFLPFFFLFLMSCPSTLWAAKICIIRGLDFPIYQEVVDGFSKEMGGGKIGCDLILKNQEANVEKEITSQAPELIIALGSSTINFVKKKFASTPTVFGMATDKEITGKMTGVISDVPYGEQLSQVRRALPSLKRIGVIYSSKNSGLLSSLQSAASQAGISVNAHAVNRPEEAQGILSNFSEEDLLWFLPDQGVLTAQNKDSLFKAARDQKLKIYAFSPVYLKGSSGADLSVSIEWGNYGQQIADLAKKVLSNPSGQYPVETPQKAKLYFKKGREGFTINESEVILVP